VSIRDFEQCLDHVHHLFTAETRGSDLFAAASVLTKVKRVLIEFALVELLEDAKKKCVRSARMAKNHFVRNEKSSPNVRKSISFERSSASSLRDGTVDCPIAVLSLQ